MMKESDSWSQVLVLIKAKGGGLSISGARCGVVCEAARYLRAATEKEMISTSAKSVW